MVRNTTVRAVAELLGKFASLALLAVLAREEGTDGVGVFVFAMAWSELATTPIGMGLDRYFLRRVAVERAELERGLSNVIALKSRALFPSSSRRASLHGCWGTRARRSWQSTS